MYLIYWIHYHFYTNKRYLLLGSNPGQGQWINYLELAAFLSLNWQQVYLFGSVQTREAGGDRSLILHWVFSGSNHRWSEKIVRKASPFVVINSHTVISSFTNKNKNNTNLLIHYNIDNINKHLKGVQKQKLLSQRLNTAHTK